MLKKVGLFIVTAAMTGCVGLHHHKSDMKDINNNFNAQLELDKQFSQDIKSQEHAIRILGNENLDIQTRLEAVERNAAKKK